jgi:radical SAM protein with 4Fe4S-binding SPASM domain
MAQGGGEVKRWAWLVVLPYVVRPGPLNMCAYSFKEGSAPCWEVADSSDVIFNGTSKEACEDLAAALNQAHERRIKEALKKYKCPDCDVIETCPPHCQ